MILDYGLDKKEGQDSNLVSMVSPEYSHSEESKVSSEEPNKDSICIESKKDSNINFFIQSEYCDDRQSAQDSRYFIFLSYFQTELIIVYLNLFIMGELSL